MKKFNKKQIAEVLGVYVKTLSKWDNEKIITELSKNCYKVIDIIKEGRSIYFYVEYEEYSQSDDEHLKEVFKVKDVENLKSYTKGKVESIEKQNLLTRKELCEKTNTAEKTSKRYDKKLIENGIIEKLDDIIYICMNKKSKERVIVDKQAFDNFWIRNLAIKEELNTLKSKLNKHEMNVDAYEYLRDILLDKLKDEVIFYKVPKMVIKYDNYLYKMLVEEK